MMKNNGFISRRLLIWLIVAVIFLGGISFIAIQYSRILPIKDVVIQGNLNPVQSQQAKQIIKPFLAAGLLGIKIDAIQTQLQQIPGVSKVEIRRVWPNKLSVLLSKQTIVAFWNQNNFITAYGELLPAKTSVNKTQLPHFYGPDDSQIRVFDFYQQMSLILQPINLTITGVRLSQDQLWQIRLSNDMDIQLGRLTVLDRLKRFVNYYPKLLSKHKMPPKKVDLRYAHGMAVEW